MEETDICLAVYSPKIQRAWTHLIHLAGK